ncbi:unnamed protein product [Linum trigynum]|uniref:Uncharacterized protein n=1 Tax=Linum trigynum TaxID=586398 RepID=A0AAV2CFI3_9ROSI
MFQGKKKRKSDKVAASSASEWEEFNPTLYQTKIQSDKYEDNKMQGCFDTSPEEDVAMCLVLLSRDIK